MQNVSFHYKKGQNQVDVLQNINLKISKGEFLAILGKNGCGKSTLIKHMNGLLTPTAGDVFVDGINTKQEELEYKIRQKVGMIFQNPDNQIVSSVVEEDVAFGPENLGLPRDKILWAVESALKSVEMSDLRKAETCKLSGGQKQRVAIAGVLAMAPECIVFDEPTSMLDPKGRKDVIDTIVKLNKDYKKAVILVTHHIEEAFNADRIIIMSHGQIHMDDSKDNVFKSAQHIKALSLGLPQSTELILKLKEIGFDSLPICVQENQCSDLISDILEGKTCR